MLAYADGFWVTSLQGAVGSFQQSQSPFGRWLRDSTIMLPLFVLAVLAAVLLARRLVGRSRHGLAKVATTAVLIVVISSALAIGEMTVSSAYDYHVQTSPEALQHSHHTTVVAAQPGPSNQTVAGACTGACAIKRATLRTHVRGVLFTSMRLLITNLVLVAWVMALRSDRLWRRPETAQMNATTVVPENWSVA